MNHQLFMSVGTIIVLFVERQNDYSTVTTLARFLGISGLMFLDTDK